MMDYLVLAGCGLTRSDAAKVLPLVLLVCQRGCKQSTNLLQAAEELQPSKFQFIEWPRVQARHFNQFNPLLCSAILHQTSQQLKNFTKLQCVCISQVQIPNTTNMGLATRCMYAPDILMTRVQILQH